MASPIKDVNDYLDAGYSKEDLLAVVEGAPPIDMSPNEVSGPDSGFRLTPLADLLDEPPEAVEYTWDRTLPAGGLSILAAKPKVGKSTLARNLGMAVARGDDFLGRATSQGPVVYLALEEKRSEVQRHFATMGAVNEPIQIHVGSAPEEALPALEVAIKETGAVLAIVDPLLRMIRLRDANDYAEVTRALEPLLMLARETGCHILCVHHAGKANREGGDGILGSTALFGGVDTAIIMRRKEDRRTLESIQRYGDDIAEMVMGFDAETGIISDAGTVADMELKKASDAILDAIGEGAMNQTEIRESVEGATKYVVTALHQLHTDGRLTRSGGGKRNDPFVYSTGKPVAPEDAPASTDQAKVSVDENTGFPVPTIYSELENQKNQKCFVSENDHQEPQKVGEIGGSGEPENGGQELPEPEKPLKLEKPTKPETRPSDAAGERRRVRL